MKQIFTDRSRIEQFQRCPRSRFLAYHQDGRGIESTRKPLPLVVGGCVHVGLEVLLREGQALYDASRGEVIDRLEWAMLEDRAVEAALAEFAPYRRALELDVTEQAQMATAAPDQFASQLAASVGMTVEEAGLEQSVADAGQRYDAYLEAEQAALIEALVRAYSRRRLRPLLNAFEVLEVEREGEWMLSEWHGGERVGLDSPCTDACAQVWFMSRPDALLRDRASNDLLVMSFKTAASWDVRKARDAEHDMQGLSEGVEIEQRLRDWWRELHEGKLTDSEAAALIPYEPMRRFLAALPAPPRILAIRYEYILKGERWTDKELTARIGFECRAQRSHLVRGYLNPGMTAADAQWCWSYEYQKEDGSTSKLYYKNWRSTPVWEHMTIREWIDMLDHTDETVSAEDGDVRVLGYTCRAQACGYTERDPLEAVFVAPVTVYRNEDDLRDWLEQTEAQERRVAEAVEQIEGASDEGERRHLLNVLMPQSRRACVYPSLCAFAKICYGSDEIRRAPLASGHYQVRSGNHPQEFRSVEADTGAPKLRSE